MSTWDILKKFFVKEWLPLIWVLVVAAACLIAFFGVTELISLLLFGGNRVAGVLAILGIGVMVGLFVIVIVSIYGVLDIFKYGFGHYQDRRIYRSINSAVFAIGAFVWYLLSILGFAFFTSENIEESIMLGTLAMVGFLFLFVLVMSAFLHVREEKYKFHNRNRQD